MAFGNVDPVTGEVTYSAKIGADGYSPSAKVTQLSDGATISITDKDGTTTATVKNVSGELIPSVSKYQSGTVTIPATTISGHGYSRFQVTLDEAMPDTDYVVNCSRTIGTVGIAAKVGIDNAGFSETGFYISVTNPSTEEITVSGTVTWQAFKLMTDAALLADEEQIEQNKTDIATLKSEVETVTSGTATAVSGAMSSGGCTWNKCGKIVQGTLSMMATASATVTNNQQFFTGLPKPVSQVMIHGAVSSNTVANRIPLALVLMTSGIIRSAWSLGTESKETEVLATFTYITSE